MYSFGDGLAGKNRNQWAWRQKEHYTPGGQWLMNTARGSFSSDVPAWAGFTFAEQKTQHILSLKLLSSSLVLTWTLYATLANLQIRREGSRSLINLQKCTLEKYVHFGNMHFGKLHYKMLDMAHHKKVTCDMVFVFFLKIRARDPRDMRDICDMHAWHSY